VGKNLVFSSFGQSKATFRYEKQRAANPWLEVDLALHQPQHAGLLPDAR
jgi:hypothetical protein